MVSIVFCLLSKLLYLKELWAILPLGNSSLDTQSLGPRSGPLFLKLPIVTSSQFLHTFTRVVRALQPWSQTFSQFAFLLKPGNAPPKLSSTHGVFALSRQRRVTLYYHSRLTTLHGNPFFPNHTGNRGHNSAVHTGHLHNWRPCKTHGDHNPRHFFKTSPAFSHKAYFPPMIARLKRRRPPQRLVDFDADPRMWTESLAASTRLLSHRREHERVNQDISQRHVCRRKNNTGGEKTPQE